jgi:hypothetical protein
VSHDHHEHASASEQDSLSEREKLEKLLDHWIKHNNDHISTYREWSEKAGAENLEDVAALLKEACEITGSLNELFKRAIDKLG